MTLWIPGTHVVSDPLDSLAIFRIFCVGITDYVEEVASRNGIQISHLQRI